MLLSNGKPVRQGTPLDENDLWIAATARALDAAVVTTDSDFQRVSGIQKEDWTP
jgi:predicted nucleic acid-binding protein